MRGAELQTDLQESAVVREDSSNASSNGTTATTASKQATHASTERAPTFFKKVRRWDKRMADWVQIWNPYDPSRLDTRELKPVEVQESQVKKTTARWFFAVLAIFLVWATFAPLDNGVAITGNVIVQGNRKAVQHPTGGVVTAIAVREGTEVKQGDVVVEINPLSFEASLSTSELDYFTAMAAESRLMSERSGFPTIQWIDELPIVTKKDPRLIEAMEIQKRLFNSRQEEFQSQQRILNEQIAGLEFTLKEQKEILGIRKGQLKVVSQEAQNNRVLADEGFLPTSRANEVERSMSDLVASISGTNSEIAKTQANLSATRLQLVQGASKYRKDIETELAEVQKARKALRTKVESLQFDRSLAEVRAPVSGTIIGLKVNTIGGVVKGGDVLMEILPEQGTLIVEAKVPLTAIDKVTVNLKADMRFSAFNLASTPVVPGIVRLVGVDKLVDTADRNEYYLAQVETTKEGFAMLAGLVVQPGMPVDVIVKTGERSFMSFLLKPLSDRFAQMLTEY